VRVYEAFETSKRLIDEGLPCEIEFGGKVIAKVWVRPADANLNADYRRELASEALALQGNGLDNLDEDTDRELLFKVYAKTVITRWTWTDPEDKKDAKLKLNEKNAIALFKRVPKFFEGIQRGARSWDQFRKAHEEDAAGN
jgi:hypothetical protein